MQRVLLGNSRAFPRVQRGQIAQPATQAPGNRLVHANGLGSVPNARHLGYNYGILGRAKDLSLTRKRLLLREVRYLFSMFDNCSIGGCMLDATIDSKVILNLKLAFECS